MVKQKARLTVNIVETNVIILEIILLSRPILSVLYK